MDHSLPQGEWGPPADLRWRLTQAGSYDLCLPCLLPAPRFSLTPLPYSSSSGHWALSCHHLPASPLSPPCPLFLHLPVAVQECEAYLLASLRTQPRSPPSRFRLRAILDKEFALPPTFGWIRSRFPYSPRQSASLFPPSVWYLTKCYQQQTVSLKLEKINHGYDCGWLVHVTDGLTNLSDSDAFPRYYRNLLLALQETRDFLQLRLTGIAVENTSLIDNLLLAPRWLSPAVVATLPPLPAITPNTDPPILPSPPPLPSTSLGNYSAPRPGNGFW